MSKITQVRGAKEENGKYYCDKCGTDLSVEGSVTFVFHGDGRNSYTNGYTCAKCENIIAITYERNKEDRAYWQ